MRFTIQFGILGVVAGIIADIINIKDAGKKPLTGDPAGLDDSENAGKPATKQGETNDAEHVHQGGNPGNHRESRPDISDADAQQVTNQDQGQGDPDPDQTKIDNQEHE